MRRLLPWLLVLLVAFATWLAAALGSKQGTVVLDGAWLTRLFDAAPDDVLASILIHARLPRALAALVVGAALATAGMVLQSITRNPLADPYLLGISGGAGLSVVLLHSAGLALGLAAPWFAVPMAALLGALAAMLAVLRLGRGGAGRISVLGLILSGVVINALCAAVMSFLLARFDPFKLRVTAHWLYGGLGYVSWPQLALVAVLVLGTIVLLRAQAHRINAFALGTEGAQVVGVDAQRLLFRSALMASLLAALGVSVAGLLGYVGLIVPHAIRLALGLDLRRTLGPTALGGALLLIVADTFARLWLSPEELPVGVLTALIGCPVLLTLLKGQFRPGAKGRRGARQTVVQEQALDARAPVSLSIEDVSGPSPSAAPSAEPLPLALDGLCWGHGSTTLGGPLSMTLAAGQSLAIVGPNGAGKSTLLSTLCGFVPALGGALRLGGDAPASLSAPQRARRVGLLTQQAPLDQQLTVREFALLGRTPHLSLWGTLAPEDHQRVALALEACDVESLAHRPLGQLSGGERQRAHLAMTLAQDAPLLLLDEPTTSLDLRHRFELFALVNRLRQDHRLAVVWVLHDLADAFREAEQILVLSSGGHRMVARNDPNRISLLASAFEVPASQIVL